jgi:ABC-2 type transport system permease protein
MIAATKAEFFKMARRSSTWISIGLLALLPLLLGLVMKFSIAQTSTSPGATAPTFSGFALMIETMRASIGFFAPLITIFISAELLAKEMKEGTGKLSLIRPVSRSEFFLSKCLACLAYNVVLIAALWLVALLVGGVLFHFGIVDSSMSASTITSSPSGGSGAITQANESGAMSQTEAFLRLAASYVYLALSLFVVGLMAIFVSTMIANTAGVVAITLGVMLVMNFFQGIQGIGRFLLGSNLGTISFLGGSIDWGGIGFSLGILTIYAVIFILTALLIFYRKDILN